MKKFIALCLSLALCLGSVVTAAAAEYGPYTLDDGYGATAYFDAAAMSTETVKFIDPDGYIYEETVSVLNLKPGSSVKITNYFGANAVVLVDGLYEWSAAWFDFSSGSVENLFKGRPLMFQVWGEEDTPLSKWVKNLSLLPLRNLLPSLMLPQMHTMPTQ